MRVLSSRLTIVATPSRAALRVCSCRFERARVCPVIGVRTPQSARIYSGHVLPANHPDSGTACGRARPARWPGYGRWRPDKSRPRSRPAAPRARGCAAMFLAPKCGCHWPRNSKIRCLWRTCECPARYPRRRSGRLRGPGPGAVRPGARAETAGGTRADAATFQPGVKL